MQEQTMNAKSLAASLIAAGLIGSTVGYSAATLDLSSTVRPFARQVQRSTPVVTGPGTASALPDFSALVEKYGDAVVNITVSAPAPAGQSVPGIPQPDPDDPFYQFFKRFQMPPPRPVPMQGEGSGFIVRSDGVILTNAHVVDGAKEVDVKLTDRREFKAKVLGVDKLSDIAVIKVDAKNLPTATLGDPSKVKVGDWVAAIGSPFGFENSVTQGIVSAKARTLPDETYVPFIQTDVAVNPGNSGGPLFDLDGSVIGINSQIYSRSGGYEGLSFAIPIDIAVNVENQILGHGKVTRGRLGVTIQDVTQALADSFGLAGPSGALISSVDPDSPAAKAGLEAGDVIVKLNGEPVTVSGRMPAEVARMKPGTVVEIQVLHKGVKKDVEVKLGELKDTQIAATEATEGHPGHLGLTVRPLTPDERSGVGESHGLLVENVAGAAARAGIQPGDVILSVNGADVRTARQLRELAAKGGKHVALLVDRDGQKLFVPVDAG
jgi:serine protease Do